VPAYSTDSVAQLALGLLLELTSRVGLHARAVAAGEWAACKDFSFVKAPLMELAGKTLGIVGFGTIGQRVGAVASALGMNIIAMRRSGALPPMSYAVRAVDRATLFREADVVSLHCPLTPDNAGFVNAALLDTMKPTAIFLNTARGGLVNEADLAAALNSGRIAGAGLDVLSVEPPPTSNPLLTARNCVITPHIAWASFEARQRCMAITVQNVAAFAAGKPVNVVS
jgi:glycerate dehydrogenase